MGDYAAQALISTILHKAFPEDPIVGEEDATDLREEAGAGIRDRIVALANEALTAELGVGEDVHWGIGPGHERTAPELLDAIDKGNHIGGSFGRAFLLDFEGPFSLIGPFVVGMWTIDPIDGTKGFLRGEQYAVCLSLIVDAQAQLGVIGCPNLPVDPFNPESKRGCIFVAVKGCGAEQVRPFFP